MQPEVDGLADLAALLGVTQSQAEVALGRPWSPGDRGSTLWGEFTIFTGRENPRTPGRPLIAIVVDHTEHTVEVGHAVGVPLPDGRMRWTLGAPRTLVSLDDEPLPGVLLADLRAGIDQVADTAMLRGIDW